MTADEIEAMILAAIPDARIEIDDLAGDGDHYAARVVSESFRGQPRVRQHQTVYAALGGRMGGVLHALQLTTSLPDKIGEAGFTAGSPTGESRQSSEAGESLRSGNA